MCREVRRTRGVEARRREEQAKKDDAVCHFGIRKEGQEEGRPGGPEDLETAREVPRSSVTS